MRKNKKTRSNNVSSAFIRNKTSLVEHISPDAKRVRQALIDSGIETPVLNQNYRERIN